MNTDKLVNQLLADHNSISTLLRPDILAMAREIERAAFRAGAEARSKQVIALIEDVNGNIDTIDFILERVRNLPLPEPNP